MKQRRKPGAVVHDHSVSQVCKQTTSNPDANSDLRGWQLLLSILAVATPSEPLAGCFKKHCEMGPVGSIPQTYAHYVLSALQKVRACEKKPGKGRPKNVTQVGCTCIPGTIFSGRYYCKYAAKGNPRRSRQHGEIQRTR